MDRTRLEFKINGQNPWDINKLLDSKNVFYVLQQNEEYDEQGNIIKQADTIWIICYKKDEDSVTMWVNEFLSTDVSQ